jgi:outer membrane receptor protein involved in Fe transport
MRGIRIASFFLLALTILACAAFSQILTGTISGTVTDSTEAIVPNAAVTIVNADTGVTVWHGVTNESGVYRAPALPVGRYNVTVQVQGFKRGEVSGVNLTLDQRVAVNVSLQPGAAAESITVTGESAGQLATDSSSVGTTINTSQVQDLPLPNRNILNLLSLTAGVSSGGDATGINASQLSINGSRTLNSEFTVNGVSVVSGSTGGVQTLPPADSIREMKVLTSAYSAEYGRSSGGVVTMVLNSGTSKYHGGLYEYFRNEDLNANNYFNNVRGQSRPQDRYNLFGGKLGGPVWIPKLYNGKEKTFFFFNYEGLRQSSPFANTSSVPSTAFRNGDFSGSPIPVYQPGTNTPFQFNKIPSSMIDPAAAKILSVLPSPNSPGTPDPTNGRSTLNLVEVGSTKPGSNTQTARIDENISGRVRIFGSLNHFNSTSPGQPTIPGPLENATGPSVTTGYQAIIGYTHAWTSTFITEMRFGFWRNNSEIVPPSLGLNVQSVFGIQRSVGPASPTFNLNGWSQYGLNSNTLRSQIDNNFQPSISATKVLGNHLVKFGWDLRKNQFNIYNPGGTGTSGFFTGSYTFTGEITSATHTSGNPVNSLADFLLGDIKNSGYSLPQPIAGRRNYNTGVFVQDDWKITRRLTLNLGLRYEYESPMTSSNNIYSRVDPATGQVLFAGINASDSLNLSASKLNFAPRVGLAFSLTPRTVIRAAYGKFYAGIFSNLGAQVLFPGYTITQSFSSLGTGIAQPFSLSQGMPLVAVQNLKDPQSTLSQFSASNPISASASFAEAGPLPYANEWNFGIQRELARGLVLETNYVGSSGVHLQLNLPNNQVPFAAATQLAQANTSVITQNARPFPNVGQFSAIRMAGHSSYNGLQITATKQYTSNFAFIANYTWSKSINDGDGLFSFSQPTGLNVGQFPTLFRNLDRSVSEFNRPNSFTGAIQYRTRGSRWLRDFEFNPILTARQGLPTTINQNTLNSAASQLRPNVISATSIYLANPVPNGSAVQYLVPASAANFPLGPVGPLFTGSGSSRTLVLPAGIGTLGRNTVRTPGELDLDLAVGRKFRISERMRIALRAEAFNLLNHTNFLPPDVGLTVAADPKTGQAVFNSPNFGLITSARAARFMQLVARFEF